MKTNHLYLISLVSIFAGSALAQGNIKNNTNLQERIISLDFNKIKDDFNTMFKKYIGAG
jgi:hypothetical protein